MSVGCKRFCSLLVSKDYFKNIELIMKNIRPISKNTSSACATELRDGFKYSINKNYKLTYEQRKFYEDNGFLVINNLVDSELIEGCRKHFVDICEGRVSKGIMTLMKDISLAKLGATGENLYNKIQDILWDPLFEKYILYPKLLDYIESFIGPNIRAVHTMLINKPPDPKTLTSRHPLHQDLHYFPFRPENKIIAAWTAMEKITTENGCLVVIPGSHKGPLLEHDYPKWENGVNKAYHGVVGYDNYPTVPLHMEKGDTVFFHPLLIHGSGANFSKGYRKAISSHYAAADVYYIDVKGTKQENIAREIEGMAARRGLEMDFIEIWKLRGRHARGIDLHSQF